MEFRLINIINCYGLDLGCPSQPHVLGRWLDPKALYSLVNWSTHEFSSWYAGRSGYRTEDVGYCWCNIQGGINPSVSSVLSSLPGHHDVSSFAPLQAFHCAVSAFEPTIHVWNFSNVRQSKPLLLYIVGVRSFVQEQKSNRDINLIINWCTLFYIYTHIYNILYSYIIMLKNIFKSLCHSTWLNFV